MPGPVSENNPGPPEDGALAEWRAIETAPKDGTPVLLQFKDDLSAFDPTGRWNTNQWAGLRFVGVNRGDAFEWSFAAPVGHGGFPDQWLAGWMPLPRPPAPEQGGER